MNCNRFEPTIHKCQRAPLGYGDSDISDLKLSYQKLCNYNIIVRCMSFNVLVGTKCQKFTASIYPLAASKLFISFLIFQISTFLSALDSPSTPFEAISTKETWTDGPRYFYFFSRMAGIKIPKTATSLCKSDLRFMINISR